MLKGGYCITPTVVGGVTLSWPILSCTLSQLKNRQSLARFQTPL